MSAFFPFFQSSLSLSSSHVGLSLSSSYVGVSKSSLSFSSSCVAFIQRDWNLGHEGISPAWATLLFLVLAVGALLSYLRWAPNVARGRKSLLILLRVLACALIAALLAKPVLHLTLQEKVRQ